MAGKGNIQLEIDCLLRLSCHLDGFCLDIARLIAVMGLVELWRQFSENATVAVCQVKTFLNIAAIAQLGCDLMIGRHFMESLKRFMDFQ